MEEIPLREGGRMVVRDSVIGIMGEYTLTLGKDEHGNYISYWDRWDLKGSLEGKGGLAGKPFEIYDRVYYDPKTYQVIGPAKIATE